MSIQKSDFYEVLILDLADFSKIFTIFEKFKYDSIEISKNDKDFIFLPEKEVLDPQIAKIFVSINDEVLKRAVVYDLGKNFDEISENEILEFIKNPKKDVYFSRLNSENKLEYFYLNFDFYGFFKKARKFFLAFFLI